jgi:hypothetical protein
MSNKIVSLFDPATARIRECDRILEELRSDAREARIDALLRRLWPEHYSQERSPLSPAGESLQVASNDLPVNVVPFRSRTAER